MAEITSEIWDAAGKVSCVRFVADGSLKAEAFDVRCLRHTVKGDQVA